MKTIRAGVFETNSSSTHSLTICLKADFEKWKNDENVLHCRWGGGDFITREELIEDFKKDEFNKDIDWNDEDQISEILDEEGYKTYNQWIEMGYEHYQGEFTTPSGDVVVAFGIHGYN